MNYDSEPLPSVRDWIAGLGMLALYSSPVVAVVLAVVCFSVMVRPS